MTWTLIRPSRSPLSLMHLVRLEAYHSHVSLVCGYPVALFPPKKSTLVLKSGVTEKINFLKFGKTARLKNINDVAILSFIFLFKSCRYLSKQNEWSNNS